MSQLHIDNLPNELIFCIFSKLPPRDMKAAVLVCRSWRMIGEDPSFWNWAVVTVTSEDFQKLKIQRFQFLKEVRVTCRGSETQRQSYHHHFCHWVRMRELFQAFHEIPTIMRIVVPDCKRGISAIEPYLLARVLNRLEGRLRVGWPWGVKFDIDLNCEQFEAFFILMSRKTKLKELFVSGRSGFTSRVSPEVLAKAIIRLEAVHICRVSYEQLLAILRTVVEGNSRLKRLRLSFLDPMDIVDVVDVDRDLIGRAREVIGEFFILEDWHAEEIEDIDVYCMIYCY